MEMQCSFSLNMNNYGIVFLVFLNVVLGINSSHTVKDLCINQTDNQYTYMRSNILKSNESVQNRIIRVSNYRYGRRHSSLNNESDFHENKKISCCQMCTMCRNGVFKLRSQDKICLNQTIISCSDYTYHKNYVYYDYSYRHKRPCENDDLRELFNDPLEVYNITYEETAVIPFISGINIYFYPDKEDKCMKLFSEAMDSKVRITNSDVNSFFLRYENCATTVRFINEYNILIDIDTSYVAYVTGFFHVDISPWSDTITSFYAEFKNHDCMDHFHQFTLKNSINERLSASDINNFSLEKQCLVKFRFYSGLLFHVHFSSPYFVYISTAFTGILVVVNICVLTVFLKKENRSTVTILLSFLAISDTLTAITRILVTLIGYMFYADFMYVIKTEIKEWYLDYPKCIAYRCFLIQGNAFNFMSALTTILLCIQKSLSFMFPVWSKQHLPIKFWTIFAVSVMVFTQICFIPFIDGGRKSLRNDNGICLHDMDGDRNFTNIFEYYAWTVSVIYCLAVVVVLTCVVYITCKLKRHHTYSSVVWSKHRRSAITVIAIGIIFIFSDLLHIFTLLVDAIQFLPQSYGTFRREYYDNLSFILDLRSFCSLVGFLLNFAVYILMSEQLRRILYKRVVVIIQKCRCRQ